MVYNCRIDPNYFWYEMTFGEVDSLINQMNKEYQLKWEQTRWLGYINANIGGAKLNKPSDLMRFSWEEQEIVITEDVEVTKQRLLDLMNSFDSKEQG